MSPDPALCGHLCDQSCPVLCDPMDCSPPGSSVCGTLQAGILEWGVAIPFSRASSRPGDRTRVSYVSCLARWVLYHWHHIGLPTLQQLYVEKSKDPHFPVVMCTSPQVPWRTYVTRGAAGLRCYNTSSETPSYVKVVTEMFDNS